MIDQTSDNSLGFVFRRAIIDGNKNGWSEYTYRDKGGLNKLLRQILDDLGISDD